MITQKIEDVTVNFYTNAQEYANDFFDMPDGAEIDDLYLPESAGFASIDDKEIWIYKRHDCTFEDLLSTVAHELGHLVEGGFKKNPPQTNRYDKKHELKAIHYENFTVKAYRIATELLKEYI